ncbi:MAG: App1 family protein [Planctomycetaceae bacterium]|nr:App1 family protein [Planctomycetaceae bacterium]
MPVSLFARMTRRSVPLTSLAGDETVALFPSLGHLSHEGRTWQIPVHGEIYSQGRVGLGKRFLLKLLQRAMKAPDADIQSDLFRARISRFLANDCKGRVLAVRCDQAEPITTKKSRSNGHFFGTLNLPVDSIESPASAHAGQPRRIELQVVRPGCGERLAAGQAYLLPSQGVSIISDIDDTLKHSHVACKQSLLANTFLREFEPIAGMSELFRSWASAGVAFHYVSSSPWQLYRHLAAHLTEQGFPDGSYHLRAFRLRDHLIRRILMFRRSGKAGVIRGILRTFPERRFVLVGDSGEIDPEIYGAMARKYPQQVAGIFIRQIEGPRNTPLRYQRAFRGVRYEVVRLFREAQELADVRPE